MNLKKRVFITATGIIVIALAFVVCYAINTDEKINEEVKIPEYYNNTLATPYVPAELSFAGEKVPMDIYWVHENLEKELIIIAYQHSKTLHTFKRSPRFFPVIEKILKEEGVPEDFKYLCVAESNLENVISPAKATGYWQFLESTGKSFGLTINEDVDERYDLEKSTRAACKYLRGCKGRLGSWALAAAAYNMGEAGLSKNMEKQQTNIYWDLYLNQETSRYLYRILAYKMIFEYPQQYGVKLCKADLYYPVPFKEYKVEEAIPDLYKFAQNQGVTYLELKTLNPWLRNSKLTIGAQQYTIKLPEKPKTKFTELFNNVDKPCELLGDSMFHVKNRVD